MKIIQWRLYLVYRHLRVSVCLSGLIFSSTLMIHPLNFSSSLFEQWLILSWLINIIIRCFITNRKGHQECWITSRTVVTSPKISPKSNLCDTLTTTLMTHVGVQYPACRAEAQQALTHRSVVHVAATCGNKQRSDGSETTPEGQREATPQPLTWECHVMCELHKLSPTSEGKADRYTAHF